MRSRRVSRSTGQALHCAILSTDISKGTWSVSLNWYRLENMVLRPAAKDSTRTFTFMHELDVRRSEDDLPDEDMQENQNPPLPNLPSFSCLVEPTSLKDGLVVPLLGGINRVARWIFTFKHLGCVES